MKWNLFKWTSKDILDEEGYVIHKKGWYDYGTYDSLQVVQEIINHDVILYNHICMEDENADIEEPRYKIEQDWRGEEC